MHNLIPFWRHASFQALLKSHGEFNDMGKYLPEDMDTESFKGQRSIHKLYSSYKDNGYSYFFYGLIRALKPALCVEIGVLQGFSLLTIASAIRDNGRGLVEGFDLFEDYPYRHDKYDAVSERINSLGLGDWAKMHRADALDVSNRYGKVDVLHVDISNTGDIYRALFKSWHNKVKMAIIFEGGSAERDRVQWMQDNKKPLITEAIRELRGQYPEWHLASNRAFSINYHSYPKMSKLIRMFSVYVCDKALNG